MATRRHLPILTLAICLPLLEEPSDRIPTHIASRFDTADRPAWISARKLDLDDLPMDLRARIQRQIENGDYQKQGCIQTLEVSIDPQPGPFKARSTIRDLTRNSIEILRGTVTGIDQGFGSYGTAALLLEIEVEERFKHSDRIAESPQIYFEYPVASFEAGGYRFCKKDSRWPEPPEIGDRVMLFPYWQPRDTAGEVIVPLPDGFEMILERKGDGALILPQALQDDPDLAGVKRLEEVRERMAEHLKRPPAASPGRAPRP